MRCAVNAVFPLACIFHSEVMPSLELLSTYTRAVRYPDAGSSDVMGDRECREKTLRALLLDK